MVSRCRCEQVSNQKKTQNSDTKFNRKNKKMHTQDYYFYSSQPFILFFSDIRAAYKHMHSSAYLPLLGI